MKLYKVHMTEDRCWDTIVRAESAGDAEEAATLKPQPGGDFEMSVTDVTEIDEDGNEIE